MEQRASIFVVMVVVAIFLGLDLRSSRAAEVPTGPAILRDLHDFAQMGSVLYIAAHPDDENTQLITYLARGRNYRTAYLSLTRGDGGQNVVGPEFGEELGVIRTQELLAARRVDGGRQFFTRAIDFGFSKDYRETLRIWDRQQVLSDIVRVIRTFRPDVLITRFSPEPGNTHGHHTASAVLALEAFKICGDSKAFPEQLKDLTPWQPKRILVNGRGSSGGQGGLQLDISGVDPVTGQTFAKLAAISRSMHKTQGFGNFGAFSDRAARPESFQLLDGEPATKEIMDGVDTTWARIADGDEIGKLAQELIEHFDANNPSASVPAILKLRERFSTLKSDPLVDEKREKLDRILQACLGLSVQTVLKQAEVVPGETFQMTHTAVVHCEIPVRWASVKYPTLAQSVEGIGEMGRDNSATKVEAKTLPANTPLTQPYWLRQEPSVGTFRVDDPSLIGRPENPPAFPVEFVFDVGGQTLVVPDEPVQILDDSKGAAGWRRLEVIPPVSLAFGSDVQLFAPGSSHQVTIKITAARPSTTGTLQLDVPQGWKVEPGSKKFDLAGVRDHADIAFTLTAPNELTKANITARAEVNGASFDTGRVEIRYDHIPPLLLQPVARLKAVNLDLIVLARHVGYIPGAGDSVADGIQQMGCDVTQLTGPDLTAERLKTFDAIVFGIRAFNVRTDLSDHMQSVFDYVQGGGTVIVQYNRPDGLKTNKIAPFDLHLSAERVTDEQSPVTFLAPDSPALNTPNKITPADFDGWVQERGLYFPSQWDPKFIPILATGDPGEPPLKGGLLIAQQGRGYFVYTGLAWFRQLPAGVPGAYRLFANLLSLGK